MTLQIVKPHIHVEDANGNPYVGAKLYVYVPGTTTPAAIYADAALSIPLANPLAGATGSDAAGNFPRAYIAAGAYKLRAETAAGVLIWQEDNIDTGLSAGSGALPIASGGTGAITATAARTSLDVPSNSELAALASDISGIQATLQKFVSIPQGRLTPTTTVPVISTGVTAGTAVYYTPYFGNLLPIYDGSQFNTVAFSELTLTLNSNHTASNICDAFVFSNAGTLTLVTGPAWNTSTAGAGARGTGAGTTELTRTKGGLWTNAFSMTARNGATTYTVNQYQGTYVGSLFIDGTNGQITCHTSYGTSRKFGVWNAYNRVPIYLKSGDASGGTESSTALHPLLSASANSLTIFTGLAEEDFFLDAVLNCIYIGTTELVQTAIGYNSTNTASGFTGFHTLGTNLRANNMAKYQAPPALGINVVTHLAKCSSTSFTVIGAEGGNVLSSVYRG
jgi:hypothetical protein